MLTRRYKPILKAQATLVLKRPNNVKKLKALPWNITLTCEQSVAKMLAPLLMKRVWRNVNLSTAFDNVNGPYKWYRPIQTS